MTGAIRAWDVLSHPWITVHCFGWKILFRAAMAGPQQTFLSMLSEATFFGSADGEAQSIVQKCIGLELRAKGLYVALADMFADDPPLTEFFTTLAQQEQDHADLLRLCAAASNRAGWRFQDLPTCARVWIISTERWARRSWPRH